MTSFETLVTALAARVSASVDPALAQALKDALDQHKAERRELDVLRHALTGDGPAHQAAGEHAHAKPVKASKAATADEAAAAPATDPEASA